MKKGEGEIDIEREMKKRENAWQHQLKSWESSIMKAWKATDQFTMHRIFSPTVSMLCKFPVFFPFYAVLL